MPRPGESSSQNAYSQGLLAYKAASYETAVELFSQVCPLPNAACGDTRLTMGERSQAIRRESTNPKFYDARASAYDRLDKLQLALIDARDVIKLVPSSSKVSKLRPSRSSSSMVTLMHLLSARGTFELRDS